MVVGVGGQGTAWAAGPLLAVGGWAEDLGATEVLPSLGTSGGLASLGTTAPTRCAPAAGRKPVPSPQGTEGSLLPTRPPTQGSGCRALP